VTDLPPTLPSLPSRGRTYGFLAGVVATLLTLAVVLPLTLGQRPRTGAANDSLAGSNPGFTAPGVTPGATPLPGTPLPGETVGPVGTFPGSFPGGNRDGSSTGGFSGGTGSTGSTGGTGTSGGTTGGRAAEPRRASDQGLTADTVKLGAFLIDFGKASDLGATVPGYDVKTQQEYVDAYVRATNARGGIGGRKIDVVYRKVDITDQATMRQACTSFGETDKVFAVFQVLGVYGDPILKCAVDQKLPFVSNDGAIASYYSAAKGYLITTQPSTRRTLLNMGSELNRIGELKGKKVGVLYEDGYLLPDSKALVNQLKSFGISAVEGVTSSSHVEDALRDIPLIAQRFCDAGVNYVLIAVNELYADQFNKNVERFPGCAPAYAVSDFDFAMNGDAFLDGQSASFFNRAVAVTSGRVGEGRVGKAEPALDAACRKAYTAQTGKPLDRNAADSKYFNALAVCGVLQVFERGLVAAGTNPTRGSFVNAIGSLGGFGNPAYGASSFTPNRYDAPEVVRISRAFANCKCWRPQTDFFAAAFR